MRACSLLFFLFTFFISIAQDTKPEKQIFKFGDIKSTDFKSSVYNIDSSASAIILADIGSTKFDGDKKGYFTTVFKRFTRIRILKTEGFHYSTFEIDLYKSKGLEETIDNIEAVTYNFENGSIKSYPIDKSAIYRTNESKNYNKVRFTLTNIKEGSIIECRYTIKTPFIGDLRTWTFQSDIPTLWSQYEVAVPSAFNYVFSEQGLKKYDVKESKLTFETFNILQPGEDAMHEATLLAINGDVYYHLWAIKDLPAVVQEPFSPSVNNYIQKMVFQLKNIKWHNQGITDYAGHSNNTDIEDQMGSWQSFSDTLLAREYFGRDLNDPSNFNGLNVSEILSNAESDKQKAVALYKFVRDNFTCEDHNQLFINRSIRKTLDLKNGSEADLNLLLTSLYKRAGFDADPVILSTREHGWPSIVYPLVSKFNYVICRVKVNDKFYLVDASDKSLGFAILNADLYNISGRVISKSSISVPLSTDSLKENTFTSVIISNNDFAPGQTAVFKSSLGNIESSDVRKIIKNKGTDNYLTSIQKKYESDYHLKDLALDSLADPEYPITVHYSFNINEGDNILYLNPLLSERLISNPFKSEIRHYPVEMPYTIRKTYILNMEIPKGYKIDEMPKSAMVKLNENEGFYEYTIGQVEDKIQLRVRLVLNKATFPTEDYKTLRDFYGFIVKKESESIVFKKN